MKHRIQRVARMLLIASRLADLNDTDVSQDTGTWGSDATPPAPDPTTDPAASIRNAKAVLFRADRIIKETILSIRKGDWEKAAGWSKRLASAFSDGARYAQEAGITFAGKSGAQPRR